jgi:hypothetical protein
MILDSDISGATFQRGEVFLTDSLPSSRQTSYINRIREYCSFDYVATPKGERVGC